MKRTQSCKRILFMLAVTALTLSGCSTYSALIEQCNAGNQEACQTKSNRDMWLGNAVAGMQAQQQMQAYQQAQQPRIHTTNCTQSPLGFNSPAGSITCTTY